MNKGSSDEHFIRRFLQCSIVVVLCPTTKRSVITNYLALFVDIEGIKNINWTSLTLHHMMQSITNYSCKSPSQLSIFT